MASYLSKFMFLVVFVCLLIFAGCGKKSDAESVENAEAKILLSVVQKELARTKKDLAGLHEELEAAKEARNELEQQMELLTTSGDEAIFAAESAEQIIQNLTVQLKERNNHISVLEKEIKEMNVIIEDQREVIVEQQNTIAELEGIIESQAGDVQEPENVDLQEEITEPDEIF